MVLVVSWAVPVNSSATSVSLDDIVSTPSLGITRYEVGDAEREIIESFQLPLSGSPLYGALGPVGIALILSTPSLGITEPYFGIFRLSAAFCRGAPSHK
jgi:hypothetical protein